MCKKYVKRPIPVEAVQITEETFSGPHPNPEHVIGILYDPQNKCVYIDTLEGRMRGDMGDWIMTGVNGEKYLCRKDIFEEMYEEVVASDFRERFKAEYAELSVRIGKLSNMLLKYMAGTLDFTPSCSYDLLHEQLVHMLEYKRVLEVRADVEGIMFDEQRRPDY